MFKTRRYWLILKKGIKVWLIIWLELLQKYSEYYIIKLIINSIILK